MIIFSVPLFALGEGPPEIPIIKDIIPSAEQPKVGGDTTPPGEVQNIVVDYDFENGKKARLSWKNPADEDFEGVVIIVRADRFPEHVRDYEGDGKVLVNLMGEPSQEMSYSHSIYHPDWMKGRPKYKDSDQYYLIVAYDKHENYSRGVKVFLLGMVI